MWVLGLEPMCSEPLNHFSIPVHLFLGQSPHVALTGLKLIVSQGWPCTSDPAASTNQALECHTTPVYTTQGMKTRASRVPDALVGDSIAAPRQKAGWRGQGLI